MRVDLVTLDQERVARQGKQSGLHAELVGETQVYELPRFFSTIDGFICTCTGFNPLYCISYPLLSAQDMRKLRRDRHSGN